MADDLRKQPFATYYFTVEINGIQYPFQSCSGLQIESQIVDVQEGGFNGSPRRLIGAAKWPNLILKKGFCHAGSDLYNLRLKSLNDLPTAAASSTGKGWKGPSRFSGTITQLGPEGRAAQWYFVNGWIVKWSGPNLDASKNEISIETIEIGHEGLFMVAKSRPQPPAPPPPPPAPPPKQNRTMDGSFATNSAVVPAAMEGQIDQVASDLKANPDKQVEVGGHTDNTGPASYNQTLSQQRADAVRNQLVQKGAKPGQVTAVGYGQNKPIADNGTASGRAQNRRVEINDV